MPPADPHLERLRKTFDRIAGDDGVVDGRELARALKIRDRYLAARVFALFDADADGQIVADEFLAAVEALVHGPAEARLRFAFDLHDVDEDGTIEFEELRQLIKAGLRESGLDFHQAHEEQLTSILFEEADANDDGRITFEEFTATVEAYPDIHHTMSLGALAWLHDERAPARPSSVPAWTRWRRYIQNNTALALLFFAWLAANAALFVHAVQAYGDQNVYVQIARGCGAALNFNGALILVPMMRTWLTWLRRTWLGNYLPIDQHVDFHKLVGHVMFALAVVHTGAHLLNYGTLAPPVLHSLLFTWAGATGLVLLLVFATMWVTALDWVRRGGHFEVFWVAHLGYVAWLGLLLMHGPRFWKWALVPLAMFIFERIWRALAEKRASFVAAVELLPSRVTHLDIERPDGFRFEPGAYVFVRIPALSAFEWHPFTISSAPERSDRLSLHIRSAGNWTTALHELYQQQVQGGRRGDDPRVRLDIELDGPYGTPSVHIFDSKVAVLIGAGIGVTPFASILQSILERKKAGTPMGLQKVYFYWLNREQRAFEWFTAMLSEIEAVDRGELLDIRIFMTGMKRRDDVKAATLHIAMDLAYKQNRIDLVTGLQAATHAGRPDWEQQFGEIAATHPGQGVDVYFCGPPSLGRALAREAREVGFGFRSENF